MAEGLTELERALSPVQLAALREMCRDLHVPFDQWRTRPELRAFETVGGARLASALRRANRDLSFNMSISEAARRIGLTYAALLKRMERAAKGVAPGLGQDVQTCVDAATPGCTVERNHNPAKEPT